MVGQNAIAHQTTAHHIGHQTTVHIIVGIAIAASCQTVCDTIFARYHGSFATHVLNASLTHIFHSALSCNRGCDFIFSASLSVICWYFSSAFFTFSGEIIQKLHAVSANGQ